MGRRPAGNPSRLGVLLLLLLLLLVLLLHQQSAIDRGRVLTNLGWRIDGCASALFTGV
jgi:hypothetical protein